MTDYQVLIIVLGPIATIVAVIVGILVNDFRLGQIEAEISSAASGLTSQVSKLRSRADDMHSHIDDRFDEMRDMIRADLRGFGERIDARLKRLGER